MKLSFLGQSYDASLPAVEATTTGETATFLGQRYVQKQFTVSQRHSSTTEMTYRGVRYSR